MKQQDKPELCGLKAEFHQASDSEQDNDWGTATPLFEEKPCKTLTP